MEVNKHITGLTVLVTGAAEGLGLNVAEHFLKNGAKLLIILDVNEEKGREAQQILKSKYGDNKAVFLKCDVTKDLERIFKEVIDKYKYVDVVINNAGILDEKNYQRTIDINLTAVMASSMKFYDYMRKDKGGKGGTIINVSSIYGFRISSYIPYYHASKFGVLGFSKSLGNEVNFNRTGVRVVTLCPGLTHTILTANANIREEEYLPLFTEELKLLEWQFADDVGRGTVEIFQQAESGEVWLVEGKRPAEKIDV